MTKVIIKKLSGATARTIDVKKTAVKTKQVRGENGEKKALSTLDTASRTFGSDLTYVFGKNVAKARRDNKRITGVLDRAPAKR